MSETKATKSSAIKQDKSSAYTAPKLSKKIGIEFKNLTLLEEALTHRSYINENREDVKIHNERSEFLGDAVLELIVSEYLYAEFPDRPEGELTSFRAATVRTESLAETSRALGIGEYLKMSQGEDATGGRDKDYLLANAFEAILGAIYLDQGYESSKKFVVEFLLPKIANIVEFRLDIDSKTKFQEVAQSIFKETPTYKLVKAQGPDHEKIFTMAVMVGSKNFGEGDGASKQRAEEAAATVALEKVEKMNTTENIA